MILCILANRSLDLSNNFMSILLSNNPKLTVQAHTAQNNGSDWQPVLMLGKKC